MKNIIEYLYHLAEVEPEKENDGSKDRLQLSDFDAKFLKVGPGVLIKIIEAANYLDVKPLLDASCAAVAKTFVGKSPREIRKEWNIPNDFFALAPQAGLVEQRNGEGDGQGGKE